VNASGDYEDGVLSGVGDRAAGSEVAGDGGVTPGIELAVDEEETWEIFDD